MVIDAGDSGPWTAATAEVKNIAMSMAANRLFLRVNVKWHFASKAGTLRISEDLINVIEYLYDRETRACC